MKRIHNILVLLMILFLFSCISQTPKDPQSTYQGTIRKAIALLENEEYEAIFTEIAHPGDVREMTEEGGQTIEELIEDFRGKPAQYLLTILKLIQDRKPVLSQDGMKAEWDITENDMQDAPASPIIFENVDGKWYIRN